MDCFHDFCLACDRQSSSGPYCSQACRLADLEKGSCSQSAPTSPTTSASSTFKPYQPLQPQYQLPTTIDLSTPALSSSRYSNNSPSKISLDQRRQRATSFMLPSPQSTTTTTYQTNFEPIHRSLTPSSSRSSLSSSSSCSSPSATMTGMSEQARLELEDYFNAFDKTRGARKRQGMW